MCKRIIFILLAVFYCSSSSFAEIDSKEEGLRIKSDGKAVALVNGEKILRCDLDTFMHLKYKGDPARQVNPTTLKGMQLKILNQLIDNEIKYQVSKDHKVEELEKRIEEEFNNEIQKFGSKEALEIDIARKNLTMKGYKENLMRRIMTDSFLDSEIKKKIEITEDEMKKHYEQNKRKYNIQEQIKASHILIPLPSRATREEREIALENIEYIQELIDEGKDFAELAREYSGGPSAERGGDLGYFGKGKMVKPFEDAAFALKKGEVSDVVTTRYGYHVIKVFDKIAAKIQSYEEAKENVKKDIIETRYEVLVYEFVKKKREESKIEIFLE